MSLSIHFFGKNIVKAFLKFVFSFYILFAEITNCKKKVYDFCAFDFCLG